MKRSKQVMLSAIFLAAISAANAHAQEVNRSAGDQEKINDDIYATQGTKMVNDAYGNNRDTAHAHHNYYTAHGGHHFLGFFQWHRPPIAQLPRTNGPRTHGIRSNGFGGSFRSSGHS